MGEGPGRGGINRGRGDADLNYENNTLGSSEGFEAQTLPPGQTISPDWMPVGVTRSAPTTDSQRPGEAGSAAATGSGAASWRRRLAPQHREVVRKFFSQPEKGQ